MNRRLTTLLVSVGLCLATQAFAQTAIMPAVKAAASISTTDQTAIKQFVQAQVTKLGDKDPAKQAEARDALANAPTGDPTPSAAFMDAYSQAVNEALTPVLSSNSARLRMNAGIVAARVADRTNTIRLKPLALKLVTDPSDAVVLWGMKAHESLVPVQLRMQPKGDDPLISGMVKELKGRMVGEIMQAAYTALRMDIVSSRKTITPEMIQAVIPTMQELLAARVAQYETGYPDSPVVDTLATSFLVDGDVLKVQTPEQKVRTAQLIADLVAMGGARAASLEKREQRDDVCKGLQLVASAVSVLADSRNKPELKSAATAATKVDGSMDPATITRLCNDLVNQIVADVPGVTKPSISIKPATGPSK